jgi:hypothetical protein
VPLPTVEVCLQSVAQMQGKAFAVRQLMNREVLNICELSIKEAGFLGRPLSWEPFTEKGWREKSLCGADGASLTWFSGNAVTP